MTCPGKWKHGPKFLRFAPPVSFESHPHKPTEFRQAHVPVASFKFFTFRGASHGESPHTKVLSQSEAKSASLLVVHVTEVPRRDAGPCSLDPFQRGSLGLTLCTQSLVHQGGLQRERRERPFRDGTALLIFIYMLGSASLAVISALGGVLVQVEEKKWLSQHGVGLPFGVPLFALTKKRGTHVLRPKACSPKTAFKAGP